MMKTAMIAILHPMIDYHPLAAANVNIMYCFLDRSFCFDFPLLLQVPLSIACVKLRRAVGICRVYAPITKIVATTREVVFIWYSPHKRHFLARE